MPRGVPNLGKTVADAVSAKDYTPKNPKLSSEAEELLHAPGAKDLGVIPQSTVEAIAAGPAVTDSNGGQIQPDLRTLPPPWAVDPTYGRNNNDARRFVDGPDDVVFRWFNPTQVQHAGMRDWHTVPAEGDSRFKLKPNAKGMVAVDNTVRKGGMHSDFLVWMPRHWYESLMQRKVDVASRATSDAVARQERVKDEMRRGGYSRYTTITSARHPSHTIGDGRSMTD